jgi:hypothetical protein
MCVIVSLNDSEPTTYDLHGSFQTDIVSGDVKHLAFGRVEPAAFAPKKQPKHNAHCIQSGRSPNEKVSVLKNKYQVVTQEKHRQIPTNTAKLANCVHLLLINVCCCEDNPHARPQSNYPASTQRAMVDPGYLHIRCHSNTS